MAGRDKGGRGITQHDYAGSHKDGTRPSNQEKDPEEAAVARLSSIAKAISQVSQSHWGLCFIPDLLKNRNFFE